MPGCAMPVAPPPVSKVAPAPRRFIPTLAVPAPLVPVAARRAAPNIAPIAAPAAAPQVAPSGAPAGAASVAPPVPVRRYRSLTFAFHVST